MSEPLVQLKHLSKFFTVDTDLLGRPTSVLKAVDDLSLDIYPGETFGLVGESGCGKTTVGKLLVDLHRPTAGQILFQGRDLASLSARERRCRCRDIQLIFQDPYASLNPRMTVGAMISEPIRINRLRPPGEIDDRVGYLLNAVGLSANYRDRFPHEFSGGQRQRVGIARALAMEPKLIVCDEPVSALDVSIQAQVLNLLGELAEEFGLTYLFIAHGLNVVKHISDRVGVMYLGPPGGGRAEAGALQQPAPSVHEGAALGDPGHESGAATEADTARGRRRAAPSTRRLAAASPAAATPRAVARGAPVTRRCRNSWRSPPTTSCPAICSQARAAGDT